MSGTPPAGPCGVRPVDDAAGGLPGFEEGEATVSATTTAVTTTTAPAAAGTSAPTRPWERAWTARRVGAPSSEGSESSTSGTSEGGTGAWRGGSAGWRVFAACCTVAGGRPAGRFPAT